MVYIYDMFECCYLARCYKLVYAFKQKKKSIHFDFRMNVFDSLSVSWLFTIRTISLHLEHSIAMSPLLLKNSSIASTPITTSCFFTISSVMNRMLWVTVRDWIDSEFSEMILMIVHC